MIPSTDSEDIASRTTDFSFEASILHKMPHQLLIQSTSSTPYCQSSPNGEIYRQLLLKSRQCREQRMRRLARFQAELTGIPLTDDQNQDDDDNFPSDDNEKLVDIVLKTIMLTHHNQILQNKINALQLKTIKQTEKNKQAGNSFTSDDAK